MIIKKGKGKTKYGPGIKIKLYPMDMVLAIHAYLAAHDVHITGARTITVDRKILKDTKTEIYVDPSADVIQYGRKWNGRTGKKE